jgi:hypothetical protein
MINNSTNIRYLARALKKTNPKILDNIPSQLAQAAIAPAAVISEYLIKSNFDFSSDLHIALIGCEMWDAMYGGAYYQLIPLLVGRPNLKIKLTFIGKNFLYEHYNTQPNKWIKDNLGNWDVNKCSLGEFCEKNDLSDFDLAVMFHPGFESTWQEWFLDQPDKHINTPNGLMNLLDAGIPVIASSYDKVEAEVDKRILLEIGMGVSDSYPSKFSADLGPDCPIPVIWGNEIWTFNGSYNPDLEQVDFDKIATIHTEYDLSEDEMMVLTGQSLPFPFMPKN